MLHMKWPPHAAAAADVKNGGTSANAFGARVQAGSLPGLSQLTNWLLPCHSATQVLDRFVASVPLRFLQVALMSVVCAWAGSVAGFASGVAGCVLATLQAGASLLRQGGRFCHACVVRVLDCLWRGGVFGAACWISRYMQLQAEVGARTHWASVSLCEVIPPPFHPSALLLPPAGALAASAVACGAGRLAASANSLAAPIVMALLKTLAFTRLFA